MSSFSAAGPGTPAAAAAAAAAAAPPTVSALSAPAVPAVAAEAEAKGDGAGGAAAGAAAVAGDGEGAGAADDDDDDDVAATGLPNVATAEPKDGGFAPGLSPNLICPPADFCCCCCCCWEELPPAGAVEAAASSGVTPNAPGGEVGLELEGLGTGRWPEGYGENLRERKRRKTSVGCGGGHREMYDADVGEEQYRGHPYPTARNARWKSKPTAGLGASGKGARKCCGARRRLRTHSGIAEAKANVSLL